MDLVGKNVVVCGLAASGRAAAELAVSKGARVVGVDLKTDAEPIPGVTLELGPHRRETFTSADLVVVSPGVPATQPDLQAARAAGVPVLGELAFAWNDLDLPCVAITGTNGKSTVTHFTGQLLTSAGFRPFVGGNLGTPLCRAVGGDHDVLVVEVSSYQLEWPGTFAPKVGIILNLTPDHLARHGDMEGYAAAKVKLFERMGPDDVAIVPHTDERLIRHADRHPAPVRAWLGGMPGVRRSGSRAVLGLPARAGRSAWELDLDLSTLTVPGDINRENAATAALLAIAMGADPSRVAAGIGALTALPHRMQVVGERDGVLWIDDGKATNVEAAAIGIGGLDRTAVVLLGGQAKGPGFDALAPLLARHRAVVTLGGSGPDIARELHAAGVATTDVGPLAEAVDAAAGLARPGDAILLSPGCASFDEFQNFVHRSTVFQALVKERLA
jgi:UDP-N-acetylmuramoylalanine--D-glutamate ligase